MKKTAYTVIALVVLVGSMAVAAQAQDRGLSHLSVNIPFQFNVGDKTMPAGKYTIAQVNPASDRAVLQLRQRYGSATAMIQMNSVIGKAQESAKLVFNRYGNQFFFAQAWIDGDNSGLQASKSRSERATEHEMAALKMASDTVTVAARR